MFDMVLPFDTDKNDVRQPRSAFTVVLETFFFLYVHDKETKLQQKILFIQYGCNKRQII